VGLGIHEFVHSRQCRRIFRLRFNNFCFH
jgi:hypothetical protein